MIDPTTLFTPAVVALFEAKLSEGPNDCWIWTAAKDRDGYGVFYPCKVYRAAHRYSYEYHVAPIPDGLELDHLCRVRACVNPAHLEPVDPLTNKQRVSLRTHCKNGHEFTPENTHLRVTGGGENQGRACRACQRDASRRLYLKNKADRTGV
jgi:hypothetical protein